MKSVIRCLYLSTLLFQGPETFAVVSGEKKDSTTQEMSVAAPEADPSVETELKSFEVTPGYEISLFADESDGIANPIAMRFGPKGRLWVLCSLVYPQIVPTETADDKLYILEDTDGDGRADKTTVFADGLDLPTGFALGDGGVYVGVGEDLVFLKDTDGDDRADTRELIATGFGTGDTHQNINSFSWSPDGELLFCQGLHAFSRLETPWGMVRLDEHGVWRLRPRRRQFDAFRGGSGQNPWGIAFGHWGEPFAKGNSTAISELLPVMVATEHFQKPLDIGNTQIKSMILEIVDSPVLPEDIQGHVLIAGYFARNIDRLTLEPDGAGHRMENLPSLLRTDHSSFRPVDIRTGPDGALYIADWFNPIIGHYQASFRHPDRDKKHGRIWRVTAKGSVPLETVDLTGLSNTELLDRLKTTPLRERERVRAELSNRDSGEVAGAVSDWVEQLDGEGADYEHHLFEALSVLAWHESVDEPLLRRLLAAESPLGRAFATRLVGRWHDRLSDPMAMLEESILDEEPRVRLEAVVASSYLPEAGAMVVAAKALDQPVDRFIRAALMQTAHATERYWWPALTDGELKFEKPEHLAFALEQTGGVEAAQVVRGLLKDSSLDAESVDGLMALLVRIGTPQDLRWVLDRSGERARVLDALAEDYQIRKRLPAGELGDLLGRMIEEGEPEIQARAIRLAGMWQAGSLTERLREMMNDEALSAEVRGEALVAVGRLQGSGAIGEIVELANGASVPVVRGAAVRTLCDLDLARAAEVASGLLRRGTSEGETRDLVTPFLGRKGGPGALAKALEAEGVSVELADQIRGVLGSAGRFDAALDRVLRPVVGEGAVGLPEYSESFVQALSVEVKEGGDAAKGEGIYRTATLSCIACHKVGDAGGVLGPELTAVGAGLPVELLIEAVLWPQRQVKEGYLATSLTTKDGKTVGGYLDTEDEGRIVIRDAATGATQTVPVNQVANRQDAGTLMPPGLVAGLSRGDLRDLIRYLSQLKGDNTE